MKITDILPQPITLVAYRYGHLYVVQGQQVLILHERDVYTIELGFTPEHMASFGGVVALAGQDGAAQLTGTAVLRQFTGRGQYSLPLAEIVRDGEPLTDQVAFTGSDVMGLPVVVSPSGAVTHSPLTQRSYYEPLLGTMMERSSLLTFQASQQNFGQLNGVIGELMYAKIEELPKMLIPYSYIRQNLHGAGFDGGYVFTPDSGRSWRKRRLEGWGVLSEKAVLSVSQAGGVQVITGAWT